MIRPRTLQPLQRARRLRPRWFLQPTPRRPRASSQPASGRWRPRPLPPQSLRRQSAPRPRSSGHSSPRRQSPAPARYFRQSAPRGASPGASPRASPLGGPDLVPQRTRAHRSLAWFPLAWFPLAWSRRIVRPRLRRRPPVRHRPQVPQPVRAGLRRAILGLPPPRPPGLHSPVRRPRRRPPRDRLPGS